MSSTVAVLPSSVESLSHIALQHRALHGIPLVSYGVPVRGERLLVVRQRLRIRCDLPSLVPSLQQVFLGLCPGFCFGVVISDQTIEVILVVRE